MLMLAFDSSKNSEGQGRDGKGKAMEKSSCIYLPPPPLHPTFLSFPSPRWADPWLSPTEKSRSLIIPTERVAKANLARGNGDPVPFPNLPISSLSFSFSICVCVCAFKAVLRGLQAAMGRLAVQEESSVAFPSHYSLSLSLSVFPCISLLSCETLRNNHFGDFHVRD